MLNEIIKIDLHIHSVFSSYKDGNCVNESTNENLDILIDKLEENEIGMCAITDHNRFNYDLYIDLKNKIKEKNGGIKNNLPGVEFDVLLETGKPKCHIIAIFNEDDDEKLKILEQKILEIRKLEKNDVYNLEEFEKILKNIGIKTILIVHQRQALENCTGNTDSLSSASSNPLKLINVGYIDCLEYNYPRSEGIVKSSLREVELDFPIITGSDCHEWKSYPYHDKTSIKVNRDFTKLKCLPTFKGLLMSITSFSTRVNRITNENTNYIKSISLNDIEYPLANGINAIIGDNGSGKSLLASLFGNNGESFYKDLIEINKIKCNYSVMPFQKSHINFIKQGSIIEQVKSGNLFEDKENDFFIDVSNKEIFSNKITDYFNAICSYVTKNISINNKLELLKNEVLTVTPISGDFYHPVIKSDLTFTNTQSKKSRIDKLDYIISLINSESEDYEEFYQANSLLEKMNESLKILIEILNDMNKSFTLIERDNKVRGIIKTKLEDFNTELISQRTSEETFRNNVITKYDKFKNIIIDYVKGSSQNNKFPDFPKKMEGLSENEHKGYVFKRTTMYNNIYLKEEFYKNCFNKDFAEEDAIKEIKNKADFTKVLKGYNSNQLEDYKKNVIGKFIKDFSQETTSISEISTNNEIGNTPGEIALVYYKFTIQESDNDYTVLVIDQPEDDINPKRISAYLNKYLNLIKDKKQVIIVTHNPLLVVNLDVDNVIHLSKINNKIEVQYGSLEYECENYNILDLIKNNLDGGYDAIERRIKSYDKDKN